MSDGDGDGLGRRELAVIAFCLAAVVLSAALLPTYTAFGTAGPQNGGGTDSGGEEAANSPDSSENTSDANGGSDTDTSASASDQNDAGGGNGKPGATLSSTSSQSSVAESVATPSPKVPLFLVESPRNAYWRQAAYRTYTGTGWERPVTGRPVRAGAVPGTMRGITAKEVTYEVTLLDESRSLPTIWRPDTVRLTRGTASLEAGPGDGIRSDESLPADSTYTARSAIPPRDPGTLAATGREYPGDIRDTYTDLPASTPERVETFTDELTAEADSPYERVRLIQEWLQTQKGYATESRIDADEPIADQFIFEVDRGFSQHFTTTMVVMLRSQDIPARYVVGFKGGERVGDNEYLVTSDRGHAWAEVYFADVGWVRVDPTAGGGSATDTTGLPSATVPVQNPAHPYNISLNRSAVAGAPVSVSVQKDGKPVVGAPVFLLDERIGWTDADGTLTTKLPYVSRVTISARRPGAGGKYDDAPSNRTVDGGLKANGSVDSSIVNRSATSSIANRSGTTTAVNQSSRPAGGLLPPSPSVMGAARSPLSAADRNETNGSSATFETETNVTVTVEGDLAVDGSATVAAGVGDVVLPNGTVSLDGDRVGTTGPNGTLAIDLAGVSPGNHTVSVRRNAVAGNATISVREPPTEAIDVSVAAPFGIPLPGGPATVTVTGNDSAIANAHVSVDGDPVGTTGPNGTLAIDLPLSGATTIEATAPDGPTATVTVSGLFLNAVGLLAGLLGVLGLSVLSVRRRGPATRNLARIARLAHELAVAAVVAAGRGCHRVGRWLRKLPGRFASAGPRSLLRRSFRRLHAALAALRARLRPARESATPGSTHRGDEADSREVHSGGAPPPLRTLWREFVTLVQPPRRRTRTPGEIARHAVERGLPERAVTVLTDLYRDAEYGDRSPDEGRLDRARTAVAEIRETGEDDE